jgi:glycosyltransferase involved in cell wall biosynthesis
VGVTTVLHYVEHWLDLSAGFVHGHVSRSAHRGVVVSHNRVENRGTFPHRPLVSLHPLASRVPPRRWPRDRTRVLGLLASAYRVRIVHVHFGYVVGDVLDLVRRRDLPLVLSLHGSDATALPAAQPGHYAEAIDLVSAVVVPSRFLADVARDLGFPTDRLHVIPAGIDTSFFTPAPLPDTPTVTIVGRLVEKKGLDVLLRAWPAVVAAVPGARLTVVGAGPLASALPGDDASVRLVAPQADRRAEQVREAIRSARVVVTPSRTAASGDAESLLLVNLEAQASGRPVVTTRHGGIPEFVVADESALLVPENDADALASALVRVLTTDALAERLAAAGPTVAAGFDIADCARRVDAVYDALAGRPSRK